GHLSEGDCFCRTCRMSLVALCRLCRSKGSRDLRPGWRPSATRPASSHDWPDAARRFNFRRNYPSTDPPGVALERMAPLSPSDRWIWNFSSEFGGPYLDFRFGCCGPHFRAGLISPWEITLEMLSIRE